MEVGQDRRETESLGEWSMCASRNPHFVVQISWFCILLFYNLLGNGVHAWKILWEWPEPLTWSEEGLDPMGVKAAFIYSFPNEFV